MMIDAEDNEEEMLKDALIALKYQRKLLERDPDMFPPGSLARVNAEIKRLEKELGWEEKGRFGGKKWMQKIGHKGALHRQMGIPKGKNIPKTALTAIAKARIGSTVVNPTQTGKPAYKVTTLLKKRVVAARTMAKSRR